MKKPEGKYEPTLVYRSMVVALAHVRRYGIEKHGSSDDWRTTPAVAHYDAMLRHLLAVIDGEEVDQESGLPHLWHLATNVMFEVERLYGVGSETFVKGRNGHVISNIDSDGDVGNRHNL